MRVYGPTGTRAYPTDRNPSTVCPAAAVSGVGGGTNVVAATYTVPAGRRARVTVQGGAIVTTALAAGQIYRLIVEFTPSGGGLQQIGYAVANTDPVLTKIRQEPVTLEMKAGDLVSLRGTLSAGAGVMEQGGGIQGVEYDV